MSLRPFAVTLFQSAGGYAPAGVAPECRVQSHHCSRQLAALILFGIIVSPFPPLLTALLMETPEVGSNPMCAAGGMFFCIAEIGGFTGPLIMGASVDLTGDFLGGALFFAVLCILFAVLTRCLKNTT